MPAPIPLLRRVALLEGISFLVLLLIAMPLKYLAQMPLAVKYVGWLHGVLFIAFCAALLRAFLAVRPPILQAAWVFLTGLLPGGPFLAERTLLGWEEKT